VLAFKTYTGEEACKKRLQVILELPVPMHGLQEQFPVVLASFDTYRYRTADPSTSWWIDIARFREDKWYATVNFDLGPSVSMEAFISSIPVASILNDFPAPNKVIAHLHTFNQSLLEQFDLDFGDEIVVTFLPRCPLPTTNNDLNQEREAKKLDKPSQQEVIETVL
jgi:hypothetical protein